jgi:Co/Zn/Cd efflux system component
VGESEQAAERFASLAQPGVATNLGRAHDEGMNDTLAHRHGRHVHSHPHNGRHRHLWRPAIATPVEAAPAHDNHEHDHRHGHGAHGHSHGLVDDSIKRSKEGVRAVSLSLGVLGLATVLQALVFATSGSIALLADLIHNGGDALTAIPLGIAFLMRSRKAEGYAGLAVVAAIAISATVAGLEAIDRLIHPSTPTDLWVLAAAGVIGYLGNWTTAQIRTRAGHRLDSAALIADGAHARADAYVSLAVVASAAVVALGIPIADPLIGLAITFVILRITLTSWRTVRRAAIAYSRSLSVRTADPNSRHRR